MTHTRTPWAISKTRTVSTRHDIYVTDPLTEKSVVARVTEFEDGEGIANAEHIVKCVNAHDELVAALELMVDMDPSESASPAFTNAVRLLAIIESQSKA
jgi:hypothetical protein